MVNLASKKLIIWDWNGTLLDDVSLCVSCMNILLTERQLPLLTEEIYRKVFTFPVKDYYQKIGFDFAREDFKIPAMAFIDLYYKNIHKAPLFAEVKQVLQKAKNKGVRQLVLSAMEHDALESSLTEKGIRSFFDEVIGLDNHYGRSKLENGMKLMETLGNHKDELVLIGDSIHDLEVAEAMGIDCFLVALGHQSKERLLAMTPHVFDGLGDVF